MVPFLLDTNIIVDLLREREGVRALVDRLLREGHPLASCPITVTEIYAGVRPHEEKPTRALMKSLTFLPITVQIAEHAGLLKAHYARQGKSLSIQDVMIAAVCIEYGCALVTQNTKDFPMPEITRISPTITGKAA